MSILELCILTRTLHPFFQGVKIDAANSSKTLVAVYEYRVTQCHIPRILKLHQHLCKTWTHTKDRFFYACVQFSAMCLGWSSWFLPRNLEYLWYCGMGNWIT